MGSGVGDNVNAVLEPGEYVLNKRAARNIGYGRLEQVNNRQGYAFGGVVRGIRNGVMGGLGAFG
ncbi:hypothetical protein, partial [Pantoea ananatis]|uniref:hypothetical protein n=1 Tax=Pantoea ananas TaxID=553 RepID=UPI002B1E494D